MGPMMSNTAHGGAKPAVAIRLYPCALVATSHSTGAWVLELASWKWQFSPQIFCCCVVFSIGSSELGRLLPRTTTPNLPPSLTYLPLPDSSRPQGERDDIDRSRLLSSWLAKQPPQHPSLFCWTPTAIAQAYLQDEDDVEDKVPPASALKQDSASPCAWWLVAV